MKLSFKDLKLLTIIALTTSNVACTIPPSTTAAESFPQPISKQEQLNQVIFTLSGHSDSVKAIKITPNGETLISGSYDRTVKLWDLKTGKLLKTLEGHKEAVISIAITPDGQILASGSNDNTVKIWDLKTGKLLRTLNHNKGQITSIAISTDGETLISAGTDKTIKFWSLDNGELQRTLKAETVSLAMSADGKTLFSGNNDGTIQLFETSSGKLLQTLTPPKPENPDFDFQKASAVSSLAVSNDGKFLVNGGYDDSHQSIKETDGNNIKVWNLETGKLIHNFSVGIGGIDAVAISPDGKSFASGGYAYEISLWDIETGKKLRTLSAKQGGVNAIAFSQDGKILVSSSGNKSIKVWRLSN
ncbi:WD40 repeat-containing protein [Rivularia sp. PCC 7116]|uniref:WD40 repeat domain-containing protein n=1 Tax=Rivularia sp. PCC 7116 TaxID=373994 RepID=UPI00029ED36C|nr:WD40 repeat domain-containing protein [Rivularia sp. PCC 7116]AFY57121.1 WD40 repeat-containing protein [Rivularia sp. PCC 7116]